MAKGNKQKARNVDPGRPSASMDVELSSEATGWMLVEKERRSTLLRSNIGTDNDNSWEKQPKHSNNNNSKTNCSTSTKSTPTKEHDDDKVQDAPRRASAASDPAPSALTARRGIQLLALCVCLAGGVSGLVAVLVIATGNDANVDTAIQTKEPFQCNDTSTPTRMLALLRETTTTTTTTNNLRRKLAGNEEDVLVATTGESPDTDDAHYQCTFRNLWTPERQPVNFPNDNDQAHWGGPIVWTHDLRFQPFGAQFAVTRGAERLAETGTTSTLRTEMHAMSANVLSYADNPKKALNVSQEYFVHFPRIGAYSHWPYLSMMAGMQPSPDWFTGFYSFNLIDEYSRKWYDHIKIQTYPWDAGTDAGTTYDSLISPVDPPLAIQRFTHRNAPQGGELMSPNGDTIPPVGELECFLVDGEDGILMPQCDYFADPCCNETSMDNICTRVLPNGASPEVSCEVQEVLYYRE